MKALLALVAGEQGKEQLLDSILTDFSRIKYLALESTHEVARLEENREKEQNASPTGPSYAEILTGKTSTAREGNQAPDAPQRENREEKKSSN